MNGIRLLLGVLTALWIGGAGCASDTPAAPADAGIDATARDLAADLGVEAGSPDVGGADGALSHGEALFGRVLAGELRAKDALAQIAAGEGWPIAVAGGFLFARLDDGAGPYRLAGDHEGWQGQPMTREAGLCWIVAEVAEPDGAKYKYIDGAGDYAADPLSRRYGHDEHGRHSLVRASEAHLERWFGLSSAAVSARGVRVWVPASGQAVTHHLYVHDGQNLFADPAAPHGGWQLQQAAGPATLVIGIENNDDRMTDYTPVQDRLAQGFVGGGADAYADFVLQVVQPLIEQRYGAPQRRGVMGSSLGGLVALHQALRHPQAYDFAASLSGTVGWGSINASNPTVLERLAAAGPPLPATIYIDSGGDSDSGCVDSDGDGIEDDDGQSWDNYCENAQLAALLEARGYEPGKDFHYWWEQGAAHDEAAWRARAFRPLSIFESL